MSGRKVDVGRGGGGGEGPNMYKLSLKASYRSRWVVSTTLMSRTAVEHLSSVLFLCLGPSLIMPASRPPDVMSFPRPSQFFIALPLSCIIVNANENKNDGMWLVGDYSSSSLAK